MGEVINLANRIKNKKVVEETNTVFTDSEDLSQLVFVESLMLLEELGYDCSNEDSDIVKDIECLSYLATAIIFRARNLEHPCIDILDSINTQLDENPYQLESLVENLDSKDNNYAKNDN